jgi:carboxyl-terminal processing protease
MKRIILAAFLLATACGDEAQPAPVTNVALAPSSPALAPAPAPGPASRHPDDDADDEVPKAAFTSGAKAFAAVRDTLLKAYYAEGLTEDDLYRAATAGMLEKLEPRMKKYNRLLPPQEAAEMRNDLKGEVVGIGVQISFDEKSGYTDVLGTLPGSPSEKAGLVAGDKIVTVNGKLYKGMHIRDVVADIRGKAGERVTLSVLRGDKLVSFSIARDRVGYDNPVGAVLSDQVGYLFIPSFTEKTAGNVKAALEDLGRKGVSSLILDLRRCPGGFFDSAVGTAEFFVPEGAPIVVVKRRGKPDQTYASKGKPILADLPLAVLVDGNTSSGAEFLAGVLREARHARIVGTQTRGKWSVQSLDDLPNGYAYKYTTGLFGTPAGKSLEGIGLTPDVESTIEDAALSRAMAAKPEDRLPIDVQLRTAKELVAPRRP